MPVDFAFTGKVSDVNNPSNGGPSDVMSTSALDKTIPVQLPEGVLKGYRIHVVAPVYPAEAKRKGIEGTVLLKAVISKEGRIESLKPISGVPELIPGTIGAVQQWRYKPYILNGEPVEVETTITVNFKIHQ